MKAGQKLRVGIFELQELEVRRFLTTASIGSSNTLNILGTGGGETITVNRLSNGRVSVTGVGTTFVPGSGGGQFNKINISAVGGNDSITISGNVPYNSATITGGSGNDTIVGGGSADRMIGDGGFDTANYSARTNALRIDLDGNADDGWATGEGDNVQTEEVIGGSGNDTITGNSGDNFLAGGGGADSITAGDGNDELVGSTGQDKLFGNDGDDALYAKNNDVDTVNGGGGPDDFDAAEVDGGDVSGLAVADAIAARGIILLANGINAAALDTTYGGNGTGLNSGPDLDWNRVTAATVDSQGRVILVGYDFRTNGFGYNSDDIVAVRYNADGTFDETFGDDGEVVVDYSVFNGDGYADDDYAFGVTTDEDDNIIIVGSSTGVSVGRFDADAALVRLNEDGSLDGGVGLLRRYDLTFDTMFGGGADDTALDVVVQADGQIVFVADYVGEGTATFAVRVDQITGDLDASFDDDGMADLDVGGFDRVSSVALQTLPDDDGAQRIIVGGVQDDDFQVTRLTPVGDVDGSFNEIGFVSFDVNDGSTDVLNDVAVNALNEIVAVGQYYFPVNLFALEPTPQFSGSGVFANIDADGSNVNFQTADTVSSFNAAAFDEDGNVVVVGSNGDDFILTRYTATFALDTSFNDGTPVFTDFTPGEDSPWFDAALGLGVVGGKIVVGGYSDTNGDGGYQTSVARYGVASGSEGEITGVEGPLTYDDVQNFDDDGDTRSPGATLYLKASHLDDDGGATIPLGNQKNVVKIYKVENEDGVEQVAVDINGLIIHYDLDTTRITINANYGNDVITATDDVLIPLFINGNGGNDTITGGGGNDQITGGSGDDSVRGGAGHDVIQGRQDKDKVFGDAGNDILIGGSQADSLSGGDGEDILIGGTIAYENDTDALESLSAEWRSGNDNATRILNLRNGGGLNGTNVLKVGSGATIFNDSVRDSLTGGNDRDWFFRKNSGTSSQRDTIIGGSSGEEIDNY